ncbi:hypothetical protein RhiJN_06366 [Ceratobasidium sp. AG-Ba]|nr:hypothetical protein RhiJN_06366 [Ceratobasidium sp. AG-Ba]QRW07281.1 hypothetical protein RhiLY_06280 [Ceratobasidium sp. AG-Ba]
MEPASRLHRRRSWRGPPLTIKTRRPSSQPPMARAARENQNLTIVYNIDGTDHYAVIPYPKSYEEALTAAVQRFSQSFASAKPTRQVWLAKGLRTRRNRWIWAECDPETFMRSIEESAAEIRLCDNEQEGFDSDDESEYLSIIVSEEDADVEGSVQTNMTSLMHEPDSRSAKSSVTSVSYMSCVSSSPARITQSLIDEAVQIYYATTDYATAIAKFEHAASVAPASHPDLKAQCYLHLGYLAQITAFIPSTPPPTSKRQSIARTPSFSTARSHFRHAHKLFMQSKNREGQLRCKQATASIALDEQDWDSARSQILYMMDAGKRDGVAVDEMWCASALALIALKQGYEEEADGWWTKVWRIGAR